MSLCPKCQERMIAVEEAGVTAAACGNCRGTWISAQALQRRERIESTPGQPHTALAPIEDLSDDVTNSNSTNELVCPDCRRAMVKERFHPQIPVTIDRCNSCGYIWLDAGELGLLLRLYRELAAMQPGATPAQQQRLDRLDAVHSQTQSSYSGRSGTDIATGIAEVVLGIAVDLLFSSSHHHYRSRW